MTALGVKQALVVAVAISILTFSYFKTQTVDPARHNQIVVRLGELKQLDATLNQDILQARSRLFHNYDPLVATAIRQRELLRSLEHGHFAIYGKGQADIDRRFEAYSKLQVERVEILERFKSKNAILKNSLSYLPVAAAELEARAREVGDHEAFADALDELVRGVLLYSLRGDEQLESHLRSRVRNIIEISAKLPGEHRLQAETVMAHASIALKSRGQVDGLIQKLMSMPAATLADDLYRAYIENFARLQESANRYRVPMYALSVGLLVYILYVLGKLKSASVTLGQVNESLNERTTKLAETNEELRGEVTERKRAEQALQLAMKEAVAANRTKSEFLANMSHELRTPLNAIIGFSDMIKDGLAGPAADDKFLEYVQHINESGYHLLSLINDILDLSKIEADKLELDEEDIDTTEVIRSCIVLVKERAANGGVTLKIEIPQELPALRFDERKLKQILINLLSNGIKFTPPGGTVTIKTWCRPDSGYVLQIIDTGIGIALEDIPKALAPFSQVDSELSRKYEGTGLGLPLTKSLVELHGGSLDLQSTVGVGTTVTIRLPAERIVAGEDATEKDQPAEAETAVNVAERGIR
ncbi:MAG: hypothetical protein IH903_04990 [Proteobacteria bacterium]|nr:hypothetical protein [Pseudomonadota bacterium]